MCAYRSKKGPLLKKSTRVVSFKMMEQRNRAHAMQALRTVLSILPEDITDVELQVLPGFGLGREGEAYVLVCAGKNCSDQLAIQILPVEYRAISQYFPPCISGITSSIPLARLWEALRRMMASELMSNLN
jgi:hypothetical protein